MKQMVDLKIEDHENQSIKDDEFKNYIDSITPSEQDEMVQNILTYLLRDVDIGVLNDAFV